MLAALLLALASPSPAQLLIEAPRPLELPLEAPSLPGLDAAPATPWPELRDSLNLPDQLELPPALPRTLQLAAPVQAERRYRTLFISDLHLGQKGNQNARLLKFLRSVDADKIYLVGDIFDGLALTRNRGGWTDADTAVIHAIYEKKAAGTEIVYIPGNHDYVARKHVGTELAGIPIARDAVHETADGRKLWIVHGDEHDRANAKLIRKFGGTFRPVLAALRLANWKLNKRRARLGKAYFNFIGLLRRIFGVDRFLTTHFERVLSYEGLKRGHDGVVTGHIHVPALHDYGEFVYANTGDWMENGSALVEHPDGRLELLRPK
jgi:UDP-2,3-diacylglucosamine pyrophosphatase LpxH